VGRDAPDRAPRRGVGYDTLLIVAALVGATMFAAGRLTGPHSPGETSPEAGFARDMQVHHIQGVEMAMVIRDNTDDEAMRRMAYDMATTQAQQAGQLYGWLVEWGLGQAGREVPMMWMMRPGRSGGVVAMAPGQTMGRDALMPGMATEEDMDRLRALEGGDAERLFLELMIEHHQGALDMSEAVLDRSDHAPTRTFAEAVLESQQAEIDLMNDMLAERQAVSQPSGGAVADGTTRE
jgi:uncharacterized protein (DUF305 family)